jgi:hypothetical protein
MAGVAMSVRASTALQLARMSTATPAQAGAGASQRGTPGAAMAGVAEQCIQCEQAWHGQGALHELPI